MHRHVMGKLKNNNLSIVAMPSPMQASAYPLPAQAERPLGNEADVEEVLGIGAGGTMTDTFFVDSDGDLVAAKSQIHGTGQVASGRKNKLIHL